VKVTFIIISELQSTVQLMNATNAFSRDPGILSPPWTFPHGHSPGYILSPPWTFPHGHSPGYILSPPWTFPHGHSPGYISLNVKAYANDVNKG